MASEDDKIKFVPPPAFKSRFLKTDKSTALKAEEDHSQPLSAPLLANTSTIVGLRSLRSTFSPLAKLPENVEVSGKAGPPGGDSDRLSKNIKDFINRTDHVANEWKNLGAKRGGSVDREPGGAPMGNDRSWSLARPGFSSGLAKSLKALHFFWVSIIYEVLVLNFKQSLILSTFFAVVVKLSELLLWRQLVLQVVILLISTP